MLRKLVNRRTIAAVSGATAVVAAGGYYYLNSGPTYPPSTKESRRPPPLWTPPSREQMLDALRASARDPHQEFDLLVVGGGATGAGVALDAASRGLKVALVERDDFSAGTSSKSTKLVHGGVRYLQKAVMELDYEQYKLVVEALHERRIFLQTAPYLSHMLPIMLPIYKYWQVPYYWVGCKMYDLLAGKENMESSYLMSKGKALEAFPMLKQDGLVGALVYYDGQHNDSRMNIALIMTAVQHGAIVANHVEVTSLDKSSASGKLQGARVRDTLTGNEWDVKAKGVINATGPFSDALLTMDDPNHKPIVQPSSGTHITLPNYYSPRTMGLLDPATSDGRVIFFLPWQGNTIAGTTDTPSEVAEHPRAQEDEIRWILEEVRRYLSPDIKVRRGDVLSAWAGLRPLVRNPNAASTEGLVRNHMIHVSDSGLLTIAGGKWTTYRAMAEETVDKAVEVFGLKPKSGCVTEQVRLIGSDGWSRNMFIGLVQRYGLETEIAKHLSDNYGDRAWTVLSYAQPTGQAWPLHGIRLSPGYPFIEAEVRYAVRHEYAETAIDVIARRCRLSFLNAQAALDALPRVVEIMAEELHWPAARTKAETAAATEFLLSMGLMPGATPRPTSTEPKSVVECMETALGVKTGREKRLRRAAQEMVYSRAQFEAGELEALKSAFEARAKASATTQAQDVGEPKLKTGELYELVKGLPGFDAVRPKDYEYVMEEVGYARSKDVDWSEFMEICAELREVLFAPAPSQDKLERRRIPVEKSGGGV
ncbi:DAO-domain-containing protein [Dichomitus squalens LYAD-421 SS1]|uniref:Glycerol-3-phosphate dehydrogenase n=1 Tax=Dichomitus squalens TaxID=114155 RepID=A0A4Q9MQC9_9APHY|nr:DAO-domain-containing protein [Dichomitus squalens LYAD-421 SS1]EJF63293.1 DAO-domain-containing protein [Dichomitus squalens LYAD-421 SS1]TBU29984.1 DAO-domain-containing protein [Dichomitus squalens]